MYARIPSNSLLTPRIARAHINVILNYDALAFLFRTILQNPPYQKNPLTTFGYWIKTIITIAMVGIDDFDAEQIRHQGAQSYGTHQGQG